MGETESRQQADIRAFNEGVQRLHDEADGVIDIRIVRFSDAARLLGGVMSGNDVAARILDAVFTGVDRIQEMAETDQPATCLCCSRKVLDANTVSFVMTLPYSDAPKNVLAWVLCDSCEKSDDLMGHVRKSLSYIWPGIREVTIQAAGHA